MLFKSRLSVKFAECDPAPQINKELFHRNSFQAFFWPAIASISVYACILKSTSIPFTASETASDLSWILLKQNGQPLKRLAILKYN